MTDPLICRFVPMKWHDDYSYWAILARHWEWRAPIVNVEHDMEWSRELAEDLLACPHSLCTHAYQMHIPRDHWAHGHESEHEGMRRLASGIQWVSQGEEWAGYSGIGFCKIAPSVRVADIERVPWPSVEQMVNRAVRGPWHIHWPGVQHYHTKDEQRIVERN